MPSLLRPWRAQPDAEARQSERYADVEVYVPSLRDRPQTLELTPTADGRYSAYPLGEAIRTNNAWDEGFTAPASSGTWDAIVLITPVNVRPTGARYHAYSIASGGAGSGGVVIYNSTVQLYAASGWRLTASTTVGDGEAVGFIAKASAYRAVHNGVVHSAGGTWGNLKFRHFCRGTNTHLSLVARMPNWGDERLEDLLRITADPWGELFEPRRIWVPVSAGVGSPQARTASLQAIVQAARAATVDIGAAVRAPAAASAALDAAVRRPAEAQASADAAVQHSRSAAAALEAAARYSTGTSSALSAAAQAARSASAALAQAVQAARSETAALEAAVRAPAGTSTALTAMILASGHAAASASAAVLAAVSSEIGVEAAVRVPGGGVSASAGAAVQAMQSAASVLGAAVRRALSATAGVNAYVQTDTLIGAALSAAVHHEREAAASVQAAVQTHRGALADLGAAVAVRRVLGAATDAAVRQSQAIGAALSTYVQVNSGTGAGGWSDPLPNGMTPAEMLTELYRIHGLEAGLPLVVGATSREAGPIEQSVSESAGVVTVTRQP